jgi:hypothetical protein
MRFLLLTVLLATLVTLPFGCGGEDLKFPGSDAPTAVPADTQTPAPTDTPF